MIRIHTQQTFSTRCRVTRPSKIVASANGVGVPHLGAAGRRAWPKFLEGPLTFYSICTKSQYKWSRHLNLNASCCLYIWTCRKRRGHVSSRNPISNVTFAHTRVGIYICKRPTAASGDSLGPKTQHARTCHRPTWSRSRFSEPQESTVVQHLEESLGQVKNRPLSAQRVGQKPWRSFKTHVKLFPSFFF